MKTCENKHDMIVYDSDWGCPLCKLTKHNTMVHDFIESKGQPLINDLVAFQNKERENEP